MGHLLAPQPGHAAAAIAGVYRAGEAGQPAEPLLARLLDQPGRIKFLAALTLLRLKTSPGTAKKAAGVLSPYERGRYEAFLRGKPRR